MQLRWPHRCVLDTPIYMILAAMMNCSKKLPNCCRWQCVWILEAQVHLAFDVVVNGSGHADTTRIGQALQPGGHIDPVAVDVVALDDNVADVDADAELEPPIFVGLRLSAGKRQDRDRIREHS